MNETKLDVIEDKLPGDLITVLEEHIEKLVALHGTVDPSKLVEDARVDTSPLHKIFEWDDTKAAIEHRLHQARQLIRTIVLRPHDYRPSDKFTIVGTGRTIQIAMKKVVVKRAPAPPPKISSVRVVAQETPRTFEDPFDQMGSKTPEPELSGNSTTAEKILAEVKILSASKSRLVQLPETIDVARSLREIIAEMNDLVGRLGKICTRCHMRNQVLNDGKHQCSIARLSSGSSNLGDVG